MRNKRVFVSGGAGVIGRELVKKLVFEGAIIMVGDLVEVPTDMPKEVYYRRGDLNYITQEELDEFNPEFFFHLAATFERSEETYEHWEENFWHNIRLSNHLMSLIRNVPDIKRVIYASSYLIYDKSLYIFNSPQDVPVKLKEEMPIIPRNLTGLAKLAHEIELDFLMKFKSDKFSSISARIFRGYGKNSRDVISRWVRLLLNNKEILVYNQDGWFDYLYAEDTAEGLLRLAKEKVTGIVNLGTGRSRKVRDVVEVLRNSFPNMKVKYLDEQSRYEASVADIYKLKNITNWVPQRTLEDTIPEIIEYEKEHLASNVKLKNVLITSISKKIPLINAVKKGVNKIYDKIKIFGGDIDNNCLGKYFVDVFWHMPRITELSISQLLDYCKKNNIGIIIPTRDGELEYFASIKEELLKNGITVMVSNRDVVNRCVDKLIFSNIKGIYAIPSAEDINKIKSNVFVVKERYGAGSQSIGIGLNKNDAIEHSKKLINPIYQPFIEGQELSIDAYVGKFGEIKGLIVRKRVVVVNGESQITTTINNENLEKRFKEIIKTLNLYGHVILQAIIVGEEIHVIECNPRFGGASTISLRAGLDSFYWLYLESLGVSLKNYPFFKTQKEITQIRYPQDFYL